MSQDMFSEFPPISTQQWEERIAKDLKGEERDSLLWDSPEGIPVQPYYRAENVNGDITGGKKPGWLIGENFDARDAKQANTQTIDALNRGVASIGWMVYEDTDTKALFKDILFEEIDTNFISDRTCTFVLDDLLEQTAGNTTKLTGSIDYDPLSVNKENGVVELFNKYRKALPGFRLVTIHDGGAEGMTDDLATQLQHAKTYLDILIDAGFEAADVLPAFQFEVQVGTDYFFEIARLRALRRLWQVIAAEYGVENAQVFIHVANKPVDDEQDEYYSMIRHTTQCMAAVTGGADSICITPHKGTAEKSAFLQRIARNVQLLLKHESHFDKVADPLAGSWYLESLTKELALKAWEGLLQKN